MNKYLAGLIAILLLVSCVTATHNTVFSEPGKYVGKTVSICGRLDDASILSNEVPIGEYPEDKGLSIADYGPVEPLERKRICVTGKIVDLRCGLADTMCFGWGYRYGIEIVGIDS
ncbi:MAG: hypothetical protein DHS20C05_25450 [Hyphococcus sp.]|nr:MAG: hypothetical protein DHS20C05_25450 [Marinicaulis sp.]